MADITDDEKKSIESQDSTDGPADTKAPTEVKYE